MIGVRKMVSRALAAVAATLLACAAAAQSWPSRPILLINAGAPGTVTDIVARQLAEQLASGLGQPVVVDSRPSAGGILALEALARSPADGYTLGLVQSAQMSVAPSLFEHLPYDTVRDFAPIGILYRGPQVLVVNASLPVVSLAEFIRQAKANPGRLRFSSTGNGTPTHMAMEQIKLLLDIDLQHIPYRGTGGHLAVVGGEVDAMVEGVAPLLPHIRAGKLRPLAVTGSQRVRVLPDVPTFVELGVHGLEPVWVGVVAPRGTPVAVVQRLHEAFVKCMMAPAIREPYEQLGRVVSPGTPDEMNSTVVEEIPRWRELVRRRGITVN